MREHRQARAALGRRGAKDQEILATIERIGRFASSQASQAKEAFATRNVALAQHLVGLNGDIERLNRKIFNRAVNVGNDLEVRESAMFMILVARCLERIAGDQMRRTSPNRPCSSSPDCSASSRTSRSPHRNRPGHYLLAVRGSRAPPSANAASGSDPPGHRTPSELRGKDGLAESLPLGSWCRGSPSMGQ